MARKYLLYVDILGFSKLAEEIAKETGLSSEHVREHILSEPFMKTIKSMENIFYDSYPGTDDYIIIVNEVDSLIQVLSKIVNIKIDHQKYDFIPIEAAMDILNIDEGTLIDTKNKDEFIRSLKTNIVSRYSRYYSDHNNNESIKRTFILSTEGFYQNLEPIEKEDWSCVGNNDFYLIDKLKIDRLAKLYQFLSKTGLPDKYRTIDKAYVHPIIYSAIKSKLHKNKIIVITGTQETGKTYTAIELLWEYFLDGYDVKYFPGVNEDLTSAVSHNLSNISTHLRSHTILYFEDPYGRSEYFSNDELERNFVTILSEIKNYEDVFVIITSRTEVFKKFRLKKIGERFEQNVINLNLKSSYDNSKREKILLKWGKVCDCKWIKDSNLILHLKHLLHSENNLPTPLNIHDFCVASVKTNETKILDRLVDQKSKETPESFSIDIKTMEKDKLLFISFLFVSDWFPVDFVKKNYYKLAKEIAIRYWDFKPMIEWFEYDQDKIAITSFLGKQIVRLFHASYGQALRFLLLDPTINSDFKLMFTKVISHLSNLSESRDAVLRVVCEYFDLLTDVERNILLNSQKGIPLLLYHKIYTGEGDVGEYTKKTIGKEGLFVYMLLSSGSSDVSEEICKVFSEVDNWDVILEYLRYLEKKTDTTHSSEILQSICSILQVKRNDNRNFIKFLRKLTGLHIDNIIKSIVLIEATSEKNFISTVKADSLVNTLERVGYKFVSDQFIKGRIRSLYNNRYLRNDYSQPEHRYRPGIRLPLTFYTNKRITNEQRVLVHIREMTNRLGLPPDVVNEALRIHEDIHEFYHSTTHEPKRIAAGIIHLACEFGYYRDMAPKIHQYFLVNPTTTRKISREIHRFLDQKRIENT